MEILNTENYEAMSQAASEVLLTCLLRKPDALFCIATGFSPTRAYQLFIEKIRTRQIDTSRMRIIKLDEWAGLSEDNPATCEYYVQTQILQPLHISQDRYISFHPMEMDFKRECSRVEQLLDETGPIDCCVLGLGRNGHLGLNEPAQQLDPFVHRAILDPKTQTHPMLTENHQTASYGYTLGLKAILDSAEILFLVTGDDKRDAYHIFCNRTITNAQPANYLWLHHKVHCIVDCASLD